MTQQQKSFVIGFKKKIIWHYSKLFVVSNWWHLLQWGRHISALTDTQTHAPKSVYSSPYQCRQRGQTVAKKPDFLASCRSTSLAGLYCHFPNLSAQSVHCYDGERSSFLSLLNGGGCPGARINKGFCCHQSGKENAGVRWVPWAGLMIVLHPGE